MRPTRSGSPRPTVLRPGRALGEAIAGNSSCPKEDVRITDRHGSARAPASASPGNPGSRIPASIAVPLPVAAAEAPTTARFPHPSSRALRRRILAWRRRRTLHGKTEEPARAVVVGDFFAFPVATGMNVRSPFCTDLHDTNGDAKGRCPFSSVITPPRTAPRGSRTVASVSRAPSLSVIGARPVNALRRMQRGETRVCHHRQRSAGRQA